MAGNWTNGVPGANDTAEFARGTNVSYIVTFPGNNPILMPPLNHTSDRLLVGLNDVTFANAAGRQATYTLDTTSTSTSGRGVIVGAFVGVVGGGGTGRLDTSIPITTAAASLGETTASPGEINLNGTKLTITGDSARTTSSSSATAASAF